MTELDRFIQAQRNDYAQAHQELKAGHKTSHWIWYIFPQLQGAGGSSPNSIKYAIKDLDEACEYLQNEELFENLNKLTLLVSQKLDEGVPIAYLMGSDIDARKLSSSMTLFSLTASFIAQQTQNAAFSDLAQLCDKVLNQMKAQGYAPCKKTIRLINAPITSKQTPPSLFFNKTPHAPIQHDYSALSKALDEYINVRKTEWSFHYNFLGFVALVYLIQDAVMGTDHFNSKNREIKINAAKKLKDAIDNPGSKNSLVFSSSEKNALIDGRLGETLSQYGGINTIWKNLEPAGPSTHFNPH